MNHQGQLLSDAGGYVRYVHSESGSRLFLARNAKQLDTGERLWFQIPMSRDEAADKANSWQFYEEDDCYLGMKASLGRAQDAFLMFYSLHPSTWILISTTSQNTRI